MTNEKMRDKAIHAMYSAYWDRFEKPGGDDVKELLSAAFDALDKSSEFFKTEPDNPYHWMWKEHQARTQAADRRLLAVAKRSLDIFKSISSRSLIVDELASAIEEAEKI